MQMIIEARFVDDLGETAPIRVALIERQLSTEALGLTLVGGKTLLQDVQQELIGLSAVASLKPIPTANSAMGDCLVRAPTSDKFVLSLAGSRFKALEFVTARARANWLGRPSVLWSRLCPPL